MKVNARATAAARTVLPCPLKAAPQSPLFAKHHNTSKYSRATNNSVTEVDDRGGSVRRVRGKSVTLQIDQVVEGENEQQQRDREWERQPQQAADGGAQTNNSHDMRAAVASEVDTAADSNSRALVTHSSAALIPAAARESTTTDTGTLPADMLPPLDLSFMDEPDAIAGVDLPDVKLGDMWQACGYHNLSDLMPDNIIRAFDTSMADSQPAYDALQAIERAKEARVAKYGGGQLPVVTVAQVESRAEARLSSFRTEMDSCRPTPLHSTHTALSSPLTARIVSLMQPVLLLCGQC